jgi:hypothetical protein
MYGDVPTHGPGCRRVRSYPSRCPTCGSDVVYYECSCGSKVFLVPGYGGNHECGRARQTSASRVQRRVREERCPLCAGRVRRGGFNDHLLRCSGSRR